MRKLYSFLVGIGLGASAGAVLIALFSPVSGPEFINRLKEHYAEAMTAARDAAAQRRAELEAELAEMQKRPRD